MPPKHMTANPTRPARYRPGKAIAEEPSSSEDEDDEEDENPETGYQDISRPQASSFPSDATKVASNLKKVDLNARRQQAAAAEQARLDAEKVAREKEEEGFVTEESEGEDSGESEEEESSEEESSLEDVPQRVLVRPTFIKKEQRNGAPLEDTQAEEDRFREEAERRKAAADEIVQEQLRKDAEARETRKKNWDDDDGENLEDIDDTDGIDPEMEKAAWKVRELKRIKRDREAIEKAEQEREEIERRRNLSKEEREAEDVEFIARQKEENENKGQMSYLQKYYHKGAFFQDDAKEAGLDRRDIMGSRFQDEVNRELLPKYMQIRDMTKLGKKSASKYRDLKSEDTGKWGEFGDRRGGREHLDERFMSDRDREKIGASGANTTAVGPRKRGKRIMRRNEQILIDLETTAMRKRMGAGVLIRKALNPDKDKRRTWTEAEVLDEEAVHLLLKIEILDAIGVQDIDRDQDLETGDIETTTVTIENEGNAALLHLMTDMTVKNDVE